MEMFNPPHPGRILYEEYMKPANLKIAELALMIGVSRKTVSEIVNGRAKIHPELAVKIAKVLNTSASLWAGMQLDYDLWQAKQAINLDDIQVMQG
jgi:addiction module HigA family antidote